LIDLGALDSFVDKLQVNERVLQSNLTVAKEEIDRQHKLLKNLPSTSNGSIYSVLGSGSSRVLNRFKSLTLFGRAEFKENETLAVLESSLYRMNSTKNTTKNMISRETLLKTIKLLRKRLVESEKSIKELQIKSEDLRDCEKKTVDSLQISLNTNLKLEAVILERSNSIKSYITVSLFVKCF
jgi:hypothetical protein